MKKYLLIIAAMLTFSAATMAQTKEKAKATPAKAKTTTKTTTARMAAPNATVVNVSPEATTAQTKADGSPDLRYKQNKTTTKTTATKATTKVKKDGTPDLRYKENKKKG